jgi:hypothetical protein
MDISTTALALAGAGYPVFPCNAKERRPYTSHGFKDATTNAAQVAAWWAEWPDALVGMPTGAVSGVYVLDIDVKNGKNGFDTLKRLGYELPDTRTHWTRSGGCHLLFTAPQGMRMKTDAGVLGEGLDRRGDGGFIFWWPATGGLVTGAGLTPPPVWMMRDCGAPPNTVLDSTVPAPLGLSDDTLRGMLHTLSPDDYAAYDKWVAVGAALHHETDGGLNGLALWDEISQVWPGYAGSEVLQSKWASFGRYSGAPKTMRSVMPPDLSVFNDPPRPELSVGVAPTSRMVTGNVFAAPEDQAKMWAGFVYVTEENKISTPSGSMLGPEQFKNMFGGLAYVVGADNSKTTDDAWKAFTHSQALRHTKVDRMAFRPEKPPSSVFEQDGETYLNTYRDLKIRRTQGDITPFLNHLEKILPVPRDRAIVLAYCAAIVQYPGVKFQWCPLIQGVPGNGKSLLSFCVQYAVGAKYSHMPRADQLIEKFNSWLVGKIFIGVEDIYVPHSRDEVIEVLKPWITNRVLPIRDMGRAETMREVCCNWIMNSNHKDALRKTENDRRFAVFYCAQQTKADLARDNMGAEYFSRIYGWLRDQDGFAIVAEYLASYAIPAEFGLDCLLSRAPDTSSTAEALELGLGRVEQEVMEAIHSCRAGFCGGWVNSQALDQLLGERKMDALVPRNRRKDLLNTLGYTWHPALRNGRASTLVNGARPVLFIKVGHVSANLSESGAIGVAYLSAQEVAGGSAATFSRRA